MRSKLMKLMSLIGLAVVATAVFQARPALADGFGAYPSEIVLEDAARGSVYYRDLGLLNGADAEVVVEPNGSGEVGAWVSVSTLSDRSIPLTELVAAANDRSQYVLRIEVPQDAANGEHIGLLALQTRAEGEVEGGSAGAGVSMGIGVNLKVNISGVQNLMGRIVDMYARDTEVGYPLRVKTLFENTGNVQADPTIEVQVKDQSLALVGGPAIADAQFGPGENGMVTAEWDTTGSQPGDYIADARVILGGATIDERQLPFKILPYGTLTRQGELEDLTLENDPQPGEVAAITAHFRNTGRIDTHAMFLGEVNYKGALVDTVSTAERLVEQGETVGLEVFVEVPEAGTYTVMGKVNFEGKETEVKELTFRVGDEGGVPLWTWVVVGPGLALIGLAGWTFRRRLRLHRKSAV